jgi:hypothetical protein
LGVFGFFSFLSFWDLNSGLCTLQEGTLLLEPCLIQPPKKVKSFCLADFSVLGKGMSFKE